MDLPLPDARLYPDLRVWASLLTQRLRSRTTQVTLASYTVAGLPTAAQDGALVFVTDDVGGPTVAVASGGDWRRVADMAVVSVA